MLAEGSRRQIKRPVARLPVFLRASQLEHHASHDLPPLIRFGAGRAELFQRRCAHKSAHRIRAVLRADFSLSPWGAPIAVRSSPLAHRVIQPIHE